MAKPPLMGRAKSRLAAEVGPARAAGFNRASTARLLTLLAGDPRWTLRLCVNARAGERYACWPEGVLRLAQGGGDLGMRMARAARAVSPGPMVILGTDTPQLQRRDVANAFAALGGADVVFGPAADGGYWLVGLARRRPLPGLFAGVRWSTRHALADTLAGLPPGTLTHHLRQLTDVDDAAALRTLHARWGAPRMGPWARPSASDDRAARARDPR